MKLFRRAMDPVSSETHFIGAALSLVTLIIMMVIAIIDGSNQQTIIGITVFGLSSISLYSASCIYHYYNAGENNKIKLILRKLDHSMIYVLIAGTYTPICLSYLEFPHSLYFLIAIWLIAIIGIIIKLFWMRAPRFISTIFYLLMGWALIFDLPAFSDVPLGCFGLIAAGGISYSIGAVIYILKNLIGLKILVFMNYFIFL